MIRTFFLSGLLAGIGFTSMAASPELAPRKPTRPKAANVYDCNISTITNTCSKPSDDCTTGGGRCYEGPSQSSQYHEDDPPAGGTDNCGCWV